MSNGCEFKPQDDCVNKLFGKEFYYFLDSKAVNLFKVASSSSSGMLKLRICEAVLEICHAFSDTVRYQPIWKIKMPYGEISMVIPKYISCHWFCS